ncbi:MAG: alcohol dehydrogenase catalytic domain-containing protein [Alphaproteobacteria bacterium]|nr:alcohol dehydrogenase catalytic domain-containing protein [Alphaproteobacteria bacterium]
MKAAVLKAFGSPLSVETVPDPVLGTGEVIVDVVAAGVLPYAAEVFSGERQYLLTLPIVPGAGAVGRVRTVGPDATRLKPGDWVMCDPTVRSRDDAVSPDIILQGLTAGGESALKLQKYFHNGSYAEQMLVPTENVTPLGPIEARDAPKWGAIGTMLVPYGGFHAVGLKAGETVLVSGATGNFGAAAVAVALAMGAGIVVAPGRNVAMLGELSRRYGARVRTVSLTGDEAADCERMKEAAARPIDVVLDILPPSAGAKTVRAAAMSVRPYGRVVLMGGVGMLGGDDLALPYPWFMRNCITVRGQWMYPREAPLAVAALIRAGLIDISAYEVTTFPLKDINKAIAHAAANPGAYKRTVVMP